MTEEDIKNDDEEKVTSTSSGSNDYKNKSLLVPRIITLILLVILFGGLITWFIWLYMKNRLSLGWTRALVTLTALIGSTMIIVANFDLQWHGLQ